ncbi:RHS repeat-associated core domain-containing protein [Luteibacter sp. UNC138MFCol5.1]|uniref:RHS repeat-associated core domain-containing protein n=1 Tax=Luteibacter sp. UNC138MFCol5.1 TaxID=1502774 RepID=UPI0008D25D35|nr:RHS repeat-associated core domain-containing protein [Luteibacter sp. UNC138MFCol5.1]SEO62343.1 RHS repeat-associated core domain-containing protein [Luteibacter sp. UNC138MFCol5.1]
MERLSTHTYDRRTGFALGMTAGTEAIDFTVDTLGRHTTQRLRMPEMDERVADVSLSANGRPLEQLGADGITRRFSFDDIGRLQKVTDDHVDVTLAYDSLSRVSSRVSVTAEASMIEELTYGTDGRLRLQSWIHSTPNETRHHAVALSWRRDGKLSGRRYFDDGDVSREEVMRYDARGRLVDHEIVEARDGAWPRDEDGREYRRQVFEFDAIDNLTHVETIFVAGGTNVASFHYDAFDPDRLSHVTETGGAGVSISYDANGAMIGLHDRDGQHALTFDAAGRLTFAEHPDGSSTRFRHGPGNRITGVTHNGELTNRIFQDGRLACTVTRGGEARRYVRVGQTLVAEVALSAGIRTCLVGGDTLGSVVVDDGEARIFGAYGTGTPSSGRATTAFAGEVPTPRSNWYLLGARVYSPALRRFLSPDPFSPFDRGGLNRYAYCGGDPIGRIDPSGQSWLNIALGIVGVAAAAVAAVISGGTAIAALGATAGSLASAVSTPTVLAFSAVAAVDIVSLVAEAGNTVATITDNESLASIFGTISLATGALGAAAGLASVAKSTAKAVKASLAHRNFVANVAASGGSAAKASAASQPLSGVFPLHVVAPPHIPTSKFNPRTYSQLNPKWHGSTKGAATHYAVDTEVNIVEIIQRVNELALNLPPGGNGTPVYLYGGTHGYPDQRPLWDVNGRRIGAEAWIGQEFRKHLDRPAALLDRKGYRLEFVHTPDLHVTEFERYLNRPGIHIHGTCFSVADPRVLTASGMWPEPVFHRYVNGYVSWAA